MRRHLVAACVVLFLLTLPAVSAAGKPINASGQLHFDMLTAPDYQNPVEQWTEWDQPCGVLCSDPASWVTNPFRFGSSPCTWDVDDHWERYATNDTLAAGVSVAVTGCSVIDPNPIYQTHYGMYTDWSYTPRSLAVDVFTPSPSLAISVCYRPQGRCFDLPAVYNVSRGEYEQRACIAVMYAADDPAVQPIAGSNGGSGVLTTVTVTVSNPTRKQIRSITGEVAQVGAMATEAGCMSGSWTTQSYPFRWSAP